jgi:hypothetical protein
VDVAIVAETGEVFGAALEISTECPEDEGDDLCWGVEESEDGNGWYWTGTRWAD